MMPFPIPVVFSIAAGCGLTSLPTVGVNHLAVSPAVP